MKKLLIWGTGNLAKRFIDNQYNAEIIGFIETNKSRNLYMDKTVYDSRENCNAIVETKGNHLILGCKNTKIPNSVTGIGSEAFKGCIELTDIEVPNSITTIEGDAFLG